MSQVRAELLSCLNGLQVQLRPRIKKSKSRNRETVRVLRWLVASALCCVLFFGDSAARGLDPSSKITQYAHTAWRIGDLGLSGGPLDVAQTADGYIWVWTTAGLFKFDGVHFTRVALGDDELTVDTDGTMFGAHDGSLYLGAASGLFRIKNGSLYHYPHSVRNPESLFEDPNGDVWMGARGRWGDGVSLCKAKGDSFECFGAKQGLGCIHSTAAARDKNDAIWFSSRDSVCKWDGKTSQEYRIPALSKSDTPIYGMVFDKNGTLWAGSRATGSGKGLLSFQDGVWKSYVAPGIDGSKLSVQTLMVDRMGSLWIGTLNQGVYRLADGRLDHFDPSNGLTSNIVQRIFEDREGDIWIVTPEGVDHFRDFNVVSFTSKEGLSEETARATATTRDNKVWIGTYAGLDVLSPQGIHPSTIQSSFPLVESFYVFSDSNDNVWVSVGDKLIVSNDGHFLPVTYPDGKTVGITGSLVEDEQHDVWASLLDRHTNQSAIVHLHDRKVVEKFELPNNVDHEAFSVIARHPGGGFWLGGLKHGLYWLHNGQFHKVGSDERIDAVDFLRPEADGSVWVANQRATFLVRDGKAQPFDASSGLPCNSQGAFLTMDGAGNMWISLRCGLASIQRSEIDRWKQNSFYRVQVRVFDSLDGAQPGAGNTDPSWSADGRLWFANGHIVQMIHPSHLIKNDLPPPVVIEKLSADRKSYSIDKAARLPALVQNLEIDYTGLSYVIPAKVLFQYKLEGHDKTWVDAGTRRQAFYTDLAPGSYRFQVKACNNDGVWNETGAAVSFTIPPAWYQTLWFKFLCVVSALALCYLFYLRKTNQFAAETKMRFDERLEERTRLARDLHDTLMQTIQGSKMVADSAVENMKSLESAQSTMSYLSEWLGRATTEGRAALDSLRSSTAEKNDLAAAFRGSFDNYGSGGNLSVNLSVIGDSREMHPIARDEVYRIGDEAIRNACLHSGGRQVNIELVYSDNMELRVRDNGKGIAPEILKAGRDGHYGLTGMRERAARIGAKLDVTSSSQGTEMVLRIPGKAIYTSPSARIKQIVKRASRSWKSNK